MDRREALKRIGVLLGGTVSLPLVNAVLSGCEPSEAPWDPRTLTKTQDEIIQVITDMIIPRTETPGANDVRVNRFIDMILSDWAEDEDRIRFLAGFTQFSELCQKNYGKPFLEMDNKQQSELLTKLDKEGVEARLNDVEDLPFFAIIKEMTLVGYYTSEAGATQELRYKPVPIYYDGCVPVEDVGRTWV